MSLLSTGPSGRLCGISAVSVCLALFAGCTTERHVRSTSPPVYGEVISSAPPAARTTPVVVVPSTRSTTQMASDQALAANVRNAIGSPPDLQVSALNGTVTLRGTVATQAERDRLMALAQNSLGVRQVVDQVSVVAVPLPAPAGRVGEAPSVYTPQVGTQSPNLQWGEVFSMNVQTLKEQDRALAERIIQGLRTDQALTVLAPRVNIGVADGRVRLTGTVQTIEQSRAIETAVERATGSRVQNDLTLQR